MSTTSSEHDRRARLSDFGSNRYSQSGEDGMIAECLRRLGPRSDHLEEGDTRVCVEFGAGDGISCSNTRALWTTAAWGAVLVEADADLFERARENAIGGDCGAAIFPVHRAVTPTGPDSIDAILDWLGVGQAIDVMSIDVDGDDFWHLLGLRRRPRLLLVEFNPTIPPHLDIQPRGPGNRMGVGILTLVRAAAQRGYTFIGASASNAFLVRTEDADAFADLETDLAVLMPPDRYMYLATDFDGRVVPMGAQPQWGLVWPPSETEFVPNQPDLLEVDTFGANGRWMMQVLRAIVGVSAKLDWVTALAQETNAVSKETRTAVLDATAVGSADGQGAQAAQGQTEAQAEG